MRPAVVAALTSKYNRTPRGKQRLPIARMLCAETGESHLGHALEIGRDILKRSQHPEVVALRAEMKAHANQQHKWDSTRRTMSRRTLR